MLLILKLTREEEETYICYTYINARVPRDAGRARSFEKFARAADPVAANRKKKRPFTSIVEFVGLWRTSPWYYLGRENGDPKLTSGVIFHCFILYIEEGGRENTTCVYIWMKYVYFNLVYIHTQTHLCMHIHNDNDSNNNDAKYYYSNYYYYYYRVIIILIILYI